MKLSRTLVLLAAFALSTGNVTWAQDTAPVVATQARPNPDLAALEPLLRAAILAEHPLAHMSWKEGQLSLGSPEAVEPESAFHLTVGMGRDNSALHYQPESKAPIEINVPGAVSPLRARYNLREVTLMSLKDEQTKRDFWFRDVPLGAWTYPAIARLKQAGLADYKSVNGSQSPFVRYEFAVMVARLLYGGGDEEINKAKIHQAHLDEEVAALEGEFSPELAAINAFDANTKIPHPDFQGMHWRPDYEYLNVNFSYGAKLDPKLVEKIQSILADYTAAQMQENKAR